VYVLKVGEFEKQDRNNLRFLSMMLSKDGVKEEQHIVCRRKRKLTGLVTPCIGTAL
jgi:hypothetical protein